MRDPTNIRFNTTDVPQNDRAAMTVHSGCIVPLQTDIVARRAPLLTLPSAINKTAKLPLKPVPTVGLVIPDLPIQYADGTRSAKEDSWRIIVDHWLKGDLERGLTTPLKDWPPEWTRGNNRIFSVKFGQRKDIAFEFLNM